MLTGWNLYSGWYGGKLEDFPHFLTGTMKITQAAIHDNRIWR